MSLHALRTGQHVKIGAAMFRIMQRLPDARWQLQNVATGEWCIFAESDLLDHFPGPSYRLLLPSMSAAATSAAAYLTSSDVTSPSTRRT
jgi:hypothetical protein